MNCIEEIAADPAGAGEFGIRQVLTNSQCNLKTAPTFIIGEPVRAFAKKPPETMVAAFPIREY
jgi:hypothetical protein